MVQIICAGVVYEAPEIKFAKGDAIICEDGSRGVITDIRRKSIPCKDGHGMIQAGDLECVFARPAEMQCREHIPEGVLLTATAWHPAADGNLLGSWCYEDGVNKHTARLAE